MQKPNPVIKNYILSSEPIILKEEQIKNTNNTVNTAGNANFKTLSKQGSVDKPVLRVMYIQ